LVASLSRPGGNVTALSQQTTDLAGKRLARLALTHAFSVWPSALRLPGPLERRAAPPG
jgi:hypothetical protein